MAAKNTREKLTAAFGEIKESTWKQEALQRQKDSGWLPYAQKIAFTVLRALRAQKMTQVQLAEKLGVTPQQVNKWLKGGENFTIDTIYRLEQALEIKMLYFAATEEMPKTTSVKTYREVSLLKFNETVFWENPTSKAVIIPLHRETINYQTPSVKHG